jgi:outer membrane immunogenic protein
MDKKIALAAALVASFSGSALAADLPSKKAPVAAPPALTWTGFYVGANAGGEWSGNNSGTLSIYGTGAPALSAIPTGRNVFNSYAGFIGGGQVGYNYQLMKSFVIGAEADIQGIAGNSGAANFTGVASSAGTTYTTIGKATSNLQYIGTVRGRVGYLVMPTLLAYGTAGFAYGGVSSNVWLATAGSGGALGGTSGPGALSYSNTQAGWTAGGGVEWMFLPNWSAKAEYLYYSLSNGYASTIVADTTANAWNYGIGASRSYNGNIVRAGVNYHFNFASAPVVAKY